MVGHEVFEVAAADVGDRVGQRRVAGEGVVRRGGAHAAAGLADFDGDVLTVGQGHDHRRTGDRCADGGGVSDGATFGRSFGGGQFDRRGIDGVGDIGNRWRGARHQVFKVAASGVLDRDFDFAGVFVDVIGRCRNGDGAGGFAGLDGDHRAVAQAHGHWRAGRVAQGRGVDNRTALGHRAGRRQRQASGVGNVSHRGHRRGLIGDEIFVIATAGAVDFHAQSVAAGLCIVRRGEVDAGAAGADRNGNGLAVGQGNYYR